MPLTSNQTVAVAFSAKDHGADAARDVAPTLRAMTHEGSHANGGGQIAVAYGLRSDAARDGEARTPSADAEGRVRLRDPGFNVYEEHAPTLDASGPHTVAFSAKDSGQDASDDLAPTMKTGDALPAAFTGMQVRRLTPRECERLQGFPDDYTLIPYRGKPAADGPRYRALGNSMAVPVMRWIGARIQRVADSQSGSPDARGSAEGWKFIPNVAHRRGSRKLHPTPESAVPSWCRGAKLVPRLASSAGGGRDE